MSRSLSSNCRLTARRIAWRCFFGGFLAHTGFDMFYQDLIGLDAYLQRVRDGWLDLHWMVGFSIMAIGFSLAARQSDRLYEAFLFVAKRFRVACTPDDFPPNKGR